MPASSLPHPQPESTRVAIPVHRLAQATAVALQRWQNPNPDCATGNDPRSSDNGLLLLFHGRLAHAADYAWQNAGRTLVDKTYLRILFSGAALDYQGLSVDELAARLDAFIREQLVPRWDALAENPEAGPRGHLIESLEAGLFGEPGNGEVGSQILFWLCPRLPLLPQSRATLRGLELLADGQLGLDASDYQHAGTALLRELPVLPAPRHFAGNPDEQRRIRQLIENSDWWRRRVLALWLEQLGGASA